MTEAKPTETDFFSHLHQSAAEIDGIIHQVLTGIAMSDDLRAVMEYTLTGPGKRLRPALVLWCCELVAGDAPSSAAAAAVALEMVHTYSLVHDDLPAMDDDDWRRGRPTCHKAFDEATAVLAGDALLTAAFEVLADRVEDPVLAIKLIRLLARAAGPDGMIAGQMADLKAENLSGSLSELEAIHLNKTAKLIQCACQMGGLCGGASNEQLTRLSQFGLKLGLGFQIADDILDVSAPSHQLGKTAGKDEQAGKLTYPSLIGLDKAQSLADLLAREAIAALEPWGDEAAVLRQLALALSDPTGSLATHIRLCFSSCGVVRDD